jgi:hypothetical protein
MNTLAATAMAEIDSATPTTKACAPRAALSGRYTQASAKPSASGTATPPMATAKASRSCSAISLGRISIPA